MMSDNAAAQVDAVDDNATLDILGGLTVHELFMIPYVRDLFRPLPEDNADTAEMFDDVQRLSGFMGHIALEGVDDLRDLLRAEVSHLNGLIGDGVPTLPELHSPNAATDCARQLAADLMSYGALLVRSFQILAREPERRKHDAAPANRDEAAV